MAISAKELRKSLSPDVAALSAKALAALDLPPVAPAELEAAMAALGANAGALGVEVNGRAPSEHDEQCALFEWAALNTGQHPELEMLFAVPNGGYRPMITAAQLKAEGVRAGVPDVCLPVARGRFHSLWIEMKRKPNRTSDAQREWLDNLRHYGHCAVVCWSADEAINTIMGYLEQEVR